MSAQRPDVDGLHARRLNAFVLRSRRIEAHSLAQDRDHLLQLSQMRLTIVLRSDGSTANEPGRGYFAQEGTPMPSDALSELGPGWERLQAGTLGELA